MAATVLVNGITVVHQGSGGITNSAPPDVCKTPTPGGPVPIPYPNVAFSSTLSNGSRTVSADRRTVALKRSEFATSTGDEPGSLGGVMSGVFKGKAKFINYSMNVKIEGENVARLGDPMSMNGNAPNTNGIETQPNLAAAASEAAARAELCFAFCMCDKNPGSGKGIYVPKPIPQGQWYA